MNRASARSKSLTSTPRRSRPTCSTPCATMSASRRLDSGHQVAQRRLLHRVEAARGAEVDDRELAIGEQHHVARVRIGVEHAFFQHLLEERAQQVVGQLHPVGDAPSAHTTSRTLVPSSHSITSSFDVVRSS